MNVTIDSESLAALLALEGDLRCSRDRNLDLLDQKLNLEAQLRDFKEENESFRKNPPVYINQTAKVGEKIVAFRTLMGIMLKDGIRFAGHDSNWINAIKALRTLCDAESSSCRLPLKEAKELIEEYRKD